MNPPESHGSQRVFVGFFSIFTSPDAKRMGMQPNLAVPGRPCVLNHSGSDLWSKKHLDISGR